MPSSRDNPEVYNLVRTALKDALGTGVTGLTFISYTPTDTSLFDMLPAGVVDYDPRVPVSWKEGSGIDSAKLTLLIEIYHPVNTPDGAACSTALATSLAEAENTIKHMIFVSSLGATVRILRSKIEGYTVQVSKTGVKVRLAWLVVEVSLDR